MESITDWQKRIIATIHDRKNRTPGKFNQKYRVDELLKLIERTVQFSLECGDCQFNQTEINTLAELLEKPDLSKEDYHHYSDRFKKILDHFKSKHSTA